VAALARTGPRLLLDALRVEDAVARLEGWNAATWSLWGGQYGGADRGSVQTEEWPVETGMAEGAEIGSNDDGGWSADAGASETKPSDSGLGADEMTGGFGKTSAKLNGQARMHDSNEPDMRVRLESLKFDNMRLLEYIPYARRRVIEVLPSALGQGNAPHLSDLCCLVTVPSPWVEAEGWRRSPLGSNARPDDETPPAIEDSSPLECEPATIEDPPRLNIWVEQSVLGNDSSGRSLIGIALRGRWGLFGSSKDSEAQWWAFRSKDCE
jgi:hypothetical protein